MLPLIERSLALGAGGRQFTPRVRVELSLTPLTPTKVSSQKLMTAWDPTDHVAMILKILSMPTRVSGNLFSENGEQKNDSGYLKP